MKSFLKRLAFVVSTVIACYTAMLIYPNWAFAYSYEYKNVWVFSDQPVDKSIEARVDAAIGKLSRSELYGENMRFNVFICHSPYRLGFFTRNPKVGGMVNGLVSQNVFLREADIAADKIIPPGSWLMDEENRTFTYFLTHEMTHAMQANYNRFIRFTHPKYVLEGYADFIAKGGSFDYQQALSAYRSGHEFYDIDSPLYNLQHLTIAYLIEQQGLTYKEVLDDPPELEEVLSKLKQKVH